MKRLLGVVLVVVMAIIGFSACIDGNPNGNDKNDSIGNNVGTGGNETVIIPEETTETEEPAQTEEVEQPDNQEITKMFITINGNKLEVTLAENSSVDALVEKLKQGDITYTADDYGNFEKVGYLGFSLPTNNTQITTQAGDVILYSGNQIVLFYGKNSWSYTRLGKIDGYSVSELRSLLGAGNGSVQVTISLN